MTPRKKKPVAGRRESDREHQDQMHTENLSSLAAMNTTTALLTQRFDQLDSRFDKLEEKMNHHGNAASDLIRLDDRVSILENDKKETMRFRWGIISALILLVFGAIASKLHWGP